MVTAGIRAHACGEGGAVARGNVELLEVSDRVEHVVCAFPTPGVAPVSGERELDRRVEYGWEHSARVCRGSTGGGTARDFRSRLALGAAKLEHAPYLSDALIGRQCSTGSFLVWLFPMIGVPGNNQTRKLGCLEITIQ